MNLYTPAECAANYAAAGRKKTRMPVVKMFLLAVLAGFFIAMGGAVTNTASHSIANVGASRVVCGLLFPGFLYCNNKSKNKVDFSTKF